MPYIIGAMLRHQLEEALQNEGCALLYGLCVHKTKTGTERGRGNGVTLLETARHEGAVAVLKAARLRFSRNADIQTYSAVLLTRMAQNVPVTDAHERSELSFELPSARARAQVTERHSEAERGDLEEASMIHAKRMKAMEEEVRSLQARVQLLPAAAGSHTAAGQKDDEDRAAAQVQQPHQVGDRQSSRP